MNELTTSCCAKKIVSQHSPMTFWSQSPVTGTALCLADSLFLLELCHRWLSWLWLSSDPFHHLRQALPSSDNLRIPMLVENVPSWHASEATRPEFRSWHSSTTYLVAETWRSYWIFLTMFSHWLQGTGRVKLVNTWQVLNFVSHYFSLCCLFSDCPCLLFPPLSFLPLAFPWSFRATSSTTCWWISQI